ncbi:MAG: hypothetical protein AMXMBFR16_12460 [Candidatus Uhrbacteria bacterium]
MLRNVNQVCGVLALIAVGCLVAFGSAGDRIVSAAPGQIGQAGDTATAIAIGGCNRCAWSYRQVRTDTPIGPGTDIVIFPRGTSGAIRMNSFFPGISTYEVYADCLEAGASGFVVQEPQTYVTYSPDSSGLRFVDGLIVHYVGNTSSVTLVLEYRLD